MGSGDWNEGMNRVGREGGGESGGWGSSSTGCCRRSRPFASRGETWRVPNRYRGEMRRLATVLEQSWDGDWYRRAYYDDGTPLGSAQNDECRIDSLAQSWAVLSGAVPARHADRAMDAVRTHLIRRGPRVLPLLAPPFDVSAQDPAIQGYPPGVRENAPIHACRGVGGSWPWRGAAAATRRSSFH